MDATDASSGAWGGSRTVNGSAPLIQVVRHLKYYDMPNPKSFLLLLAICMAPSWASEVEKIEEFISNKPIVEPMDSKTLKQSYTIDDVCTKAKELKGTETEDEVIRKLGIPSFYGAKSITYLPISDEGHILLNTSGGIVQVFLKDKVLQKVKITPKGVKENDSVIILRPK
ncbi:MAG: hypothetical protein H0W64_12645 [Gammaproteobacteria bacterium]|nr:hypothetical protein [Gammaproteobacteria bacterium]